MKNLRSAFSSRALSSDIEHMEPVTRSAERYKQQQMATYEVSTVEIFCEKDKAVCTFGGNKIPGAQMPVSEYHSHNVSDLLPVHV